MVQQRGEGAEPVVMLRSQRNDRRRRHSRASTPKWEIDDSGFIPVVALAALSYCETERLKGGSRDPGWEGSSSA
jgi:hypothetical protein